MARPRKNGPRPEDIVLTLSDGPLTTQEIAACLDIDDSTKMHPVLNQLERDGRVVRQGHKMMARPGAKQAGKRIIWSLPTISASVPADQGKQP